MLNIEPWGKIHVSPLSSLTFPCLIKPPPQLFLLLVGATISQQENHYYAHTYSLSLSMMWLLRADGMSTMGIESLFSFLTRAELKGPTIRCWGVCWFSLFTGIASLRWVLLCLTDLLACGSILFSVHAEFCVFLHHHQTCVTILLLYC